MQVVCRTRVAEDAPVADEGVAYRINRTGHTHVALPSFRSGTAHACCILLATLLALPDVRLVVLGHVVDLASLVRREAVAVSAACFKTKVPLFLFVHLPQEMDREEPLGRERIGAYIETRCTKHRKTPRRGFDCGGGGAHSQDMNTRVSVCPRILRFFVGWRVVYIWRGRVRRTVPFTSNVLKTTCASRTWRLSSVGVNQSPHIEHSRHPLFMWSS